MCTFAKNSYFLTMKSIVKNLVAFVCIFLALSNIPLKAENFEQVIERLPAEKEDDIYSKINNLLSTTNNVTGGILEMLEGVNDLDVEKFLASIDKIKDPFVKKQIEKRKKLEKERDEALARFNLIINDDAVPDSEKISAAIRLADAYFAINEIPSAEYPVKRALLLKDVNEHASEKRAILHTYLFNCFQNSGKAERAKRLLKTMEKEYSSDPQSYSYGQYLRCRALFNYDQTYYNAALEKLREADCVLQKYTDIPGTKELLNSDGLLIAELSVRTNESSEADASLAMLKKLNAEDGDDMQDQEYAQLAFQLVRHLFEMKAMKSAFDLAEVVLSLTQTLNPDGSELELEILATIGDMITYNSSLPAAQRVDNKFTRNGDYYYLYGCKVIAEKIWDRKNNGKNDLIHNINKSLAKVYARKSADGFREAEKYRPSNVALAMIAKPGSLEQEQYSLFAKTHNRAEFHSKRARQLYEEELSDLRAELHDRFLALNDRERSSYAQSMNEFCNDILTFSETHRKDSHTRKMVYDVCLLRKAILLDLSRSLSSIVKDSNDPALQQKYAALTEMRTAVTSAIQTNEPTDKVNELEARADALEDEIILYLGDLRTYDPASFILTTWKDVKESLPKNSVAVEFYNVSATRDDGHSYKADRMAVMTPDHDPEIFTIDMLQSNLNKVKEKPYDEMLRWSFYYKVWEPLAKKKFITAKKATTIYFSPNGLYHSIPLEYLPCEGSKNMSDLYKMIRVSSTRTLPHNHHCALSSATLYGDMRYDMGSEARGSKFGELASSFRGDSNGKSPLKDLPHTKDEVNAISSIISPVGSVETITGEDCIEENFKRLSGSGTHVVHIATHGLFDGSSNSMHHSGLAFNGAATMNDNDAGSDIDDGRLTAAEISHMDLSETDMVVLSACSSGKGHVTEEGVFGLQRGFKLAGVNSIVMSLWDVDDKATMDLMTTFYKGLADGATKRDALRMAQEYVKTKTYTIKEKENDTPKTVPGTNPRLWSGFIILD